jgi:4-carboxymuconolactone decarboxylase
MNSNSMNIHPTESKSRITPRPTSEMREEWLEILGRIPGDGLKGEGFPHNVLGVIMHNADTFGPFMDYWVTCKLKMGLSVREQELIILRMGYLYRSNYVWKHHVPVGREFGVTDPELNALRQGQTEGFVSREASLLALTDEIVNQRTIRADAWKDHKQNLSDRDLVDLVHLISQYVLFAVMNNAMQVQVEAALDDVPGIED